jgi:hypothetical protein
MTNVELLTHFLALAITAPTDDKAKQASDHAEYIAAQCIHKGEFTADTIELAKRKALKLADEWLAA